MALRTIDAVKNAACDAVVDLVDVGAGTNGTIQFYSGSRPANVGDAPAGTLLAEVDFAATAFGAAGATTAGVASAASVPLETTGLAAGTIGFARIRDADDTGLWDDDDVGTSGNAITVNTTTVSTGVAFSVTSYDFNVADPV